jgi:hypothetical protein
VRGGGLDEAFRQLTTEPGPTDRLDQTDRQARP